MEEREGHIQAMISKSGDSRGPGNQTGVIRLLDKYLYPPSHLSGPISTVLNK